MLALPKLAWVLLAVAGVQFAALLGIQVFLFVEARDGSSAIVFTAPFVFLLSVDTVLRRNSIQLCNVVLSNLWLLIYTLVRLVELIVYNRSNAATYARLYGPISFTLPAVQVAIVLVAQIALLYISIKLYKLWGWSAFVTEGDEKLRVRAARAYQIYLSLLCATFLYIVHGCIAPFISLRNTSSGITPFISLFAYLPVAIVLIVEVLALRFEKKWLCWVLVPFGVVALAFVVGIVVVSDFAIGQLSNYAIDCRGSNRTRCANLTIPIQWSNVIFFNAIVPIYLARYILGLVCFHWFGRGIHKPAEAAVARDMQEVASTAPMTVPIDNSRRTTEGDVVYQGLPLSEIEEERRQPVASGSAM